ncbi:hypothetical protein BgAZ_103960 [Babesia gibsoni]|uniref:OTU domain-containing protein n=1 Tax=Babesia gibsoni TaxID=33632 RepID=A0AAD8URP6_BABGI|nr:hypothetical protein BgAZ_103960 [Babesia gibsoni]
MKSYVTVVSLFLFSMVTAKVWYPVDVKDDLCNRIKNGENIPTDEEDIYDKIKKLDVSTLSREIAYSVMIGRENYAMPLLAHPWEYTTPLSFMEQRLRLYGMSIAKHETPKDGNCLFHALSMIFIKNGYSAKVLQKFINERIKPSVRAAYEEFKPSGAYYTASELRKLSQVVYWGFDPDSKESMDKFDEDHYLNILRDIIITSVVPDPNVNPSAMSRGTFDYKAYMDQIDGGKEVKEVASEMFRDMLKYFVNVFGDYLDINNLELLFSFKTVLFNIESQKLSCGEVSRDSRIQFFVTLYYQENSHFAIQGLIDLHEPYQPYEPISAFLAQDLPIPLAMMMVDDCRLARDD